jgi:hypothetical protein
MRFLLTLDRLRHRIPFWWWLTYDALVGLVIALGFFGFRDSALWVGVFVLTIAVVIDVAEFLVKRPGSRAMIADYYAALDAKEEDNRIEAARLR